MPVVMCPWQRDTRLHTRLHKRFPESVRSTRVSVRSAVCSGVWGRGFMGSEVM